MKNQNTTPRHTPPIESVLEIRICPEMWDRIKWVAATRQSSYSWVVRYALFRLIKRIDPKRSFPHIGNPRLLSAPAGGFNQRAWERRLGAAQRGLGAKHRHRLCLYGQDELAIRHAAAYYRCTITHLTRVALELYFEPLYARMLRASPWGHSPRMTYLQRAFWFWLGIKLYRGVEFHSTSLERRLLLFQRYKPAEYHTRGG